MRRFTLMLAFLFGLAATPFAVQAQDGTNDDNDSMDPVTEGLPVDEEVEEAHDASQFGLETAGEARELRDNASEVGKDFGSDTSVRAKEELGN